MNYLKRFSSILILISGFTIILTLVVNILIILLIPQYFNITIIITIDLIFCILFFFLYKYIYFPLKRSEKIINSEIETFIKTFKKEKFVKKQYIDQAISEIITIEKEYYQRAIQLELLYKNAELSALQNQINPHFLYNTLESIRGLALTKGIKEIAQMTKALSKLFRNNITKKDSLISLSEEIENINNYLYIQNFRFNDRFHFNLKVDEEDDLLNCKIINFSIQPIIENAIFHGLERKQSQGTIEMHIYKTTNFLYISITDNGCGIDSDKVKQLNNSLRKEVVNQENVNTDSTNGIGLFNINQRIKIQFGNEYGIDISSTKDLGTQVEVKLPIHMES